MSKDAPIMLIIRKFVRSSMSEDLDARQDVSVSEGCPETGESGEAANVEAESERLGHNSSLPSRLLDLKLLRHAAAFERLFSLGET